MDAGSSLALQGAENRVDQPCGAHHPHSSVITHTKHQGADSFIHLLQVAAG